MNIVWDLDGVIRDLNGYIMHLHGGAYPKTWNHICGNGKNIFDTINENLDILIDAPPTAYCSVLKKHFTKPEFWTSQPEKWQENTVKWLDFYVGEHTVKFLKSAQKEALLSTLENTILIEDNPNFLDYENIILIDRPYNQVVKNAIRIFGTRHLNNLISVIKET